MEEFEIDDDLHPIDPPARPLIHVSDCPLLVGDYAPLRKIQAPECGRRAIDDLPIVRPGLVWVGDVVTDPEVLRQHAAALLEAASWLAGAPRKDPPPIAWRQDHNGEWNEAKVDEGCYCGHGAYHHEGGGWPATPVNGRCRERGCDCSEFQRKAFDRG